MNAASCMAFLQKQQPDVILMDINLPDKSGIDLCREVRENIPLYLSLASARSTSKVLFRK